MVDPAVRAPKTGNIVAERIRSQIMSGALVEGDFLPRASELMLVLGVSRAPLREAFRILEEEGLIAMVGGSRRGAQVRQPSVDALARNASLILKFQGMTVADLYDARLAIEPVAVRRLALERVPEATAKLRQMLEEMSSLVNDDASYDFLHMVEPFHQALVAASGMKSLTFLSLMLGNLWAAHRTGFQRRNPVSDAERRRMTVFAFTPYQELLELIETGRADEASAHWQTHLHRASRYLTGNEEGKKTVGVTAQ